jgi:signal transduction histidine kinase
MDEEQRKGKKGFEKFYMKSSLKGIRIGLALGTLLFMLFGLVDKAMVQWVIRYLFICPVMLVTFGLSYARFFLRFAQVIMSVAYVIVSVCLIFMIKYTEVANEARETYAIGLTLCIIGTSAVRMRRNWVLGSSIIILAVFAWAIDNHHDLFIHFPIFASAVVVTVLSISSTERILKDNYKTFILLNEESNNLKSVKEELESSDELKGKMLSIIAHDLRGPTNSMSAILQLLNSNKISQSEFDEHSKKIQNQIQGNQILLENLLRWSLLKMDNKINITEVDIHDLIEECVELVRGSALLKGNEVLNRIDSMVISTDPDILKLVIRNLLSNAVKFTEKGSIICTNKISDSRLTIYIKDTGIGMTKERADQLFNWKRRISTAGTKQETGSGFGLLISQEFLEMLGAKMEIKTALGQGTTIEVILRQ